jgi:hypothetical protein
MGLGRQRHAPSSLAPGKKTGTHFTGGWVGARPGLDGCGKSRPTGIRAPNRPARSESYLWLVRRKHEISRLREETVCP